MKLPASLYFGSKNAEVVSYETDGLMIKDDKKKLDNIEENANNYIHPTNHDASMITQSASYRFVTDTQIYKWDTKASTDIVSISNNGLMSKEDKIKLNTVENNANNYIHPRNHDASMITQSASYRFVTDTQISTWNAKATVDVANQTSNGLMSYEDKKKLDGIATGANNYIHPLKHGASVIIQDESNRFVTDIQIARWDSKAENQLATSGLNGLMSKSDKVKLDSYKWFTLATEKTVSVGESISLSHPITTSKFITITDSESINNGESSPVYKDIGNCKYLVFSIKDIDISNLASIEKVYKFEIITETQLVYLGGIRIKFKDNTVLTKSIDSETFTFLGYYL